MFRRSCGACKFCNTTRPSDITIADFWGWEKTNPTFNQDDKGVSLILVNTKKGQEIFNAAKDRMNYFPANLEDCLQPNLKHPSKIHRKRMEFETDYVEKGFEYVINKQYQSETLLKRLIHKLKKIMKKYI